MKTRTMVVTALLIVFAVTPFVLAQDEAPAEPQRPQRPQAGQGMGGGMREGMGGGMMGGMGGGMAQMGNDIMGILMRASAELELTEEQRTSFRTMMRDRAGVRETRQKLQEAQTALRQAIFQGDQAATEKAVTALMQATREDAVAQATMAKAFRDMLTPQQIQKLNQVDISAPVDPAAPGAAGALRRGQGEQGQGQAPRQGMGQGQGQGQEPGQRRPRQQQQ